jgi:hypothetical protein
MSALDALNKFSSKDAKKHGPKKKRTKNKSPEKDVEREVMAWLIAHSFSCNVVESKAVFSTAANRYVRGQAVQGFSDIVGCDNAGRAVFIELKAAGRRNTLRPAQFVFLEEKIKHGAFAVCTDSVDFLSMAYDHWIKVSDENKKTFLLSLLPDVKF